MNNRHNLVTLRILLVLTFISAGAYLFSYLTTALMLPYMKQMVEANPEMVPEQMRTMFDTFLSLPRAFFSVMALLYALELAGAVLMWRLRKLGFHCYALSRLLMLLVPLLFVGREFVKLGDVMFAVLFIGMYWVLLRSLGAFSDRDGEPPADTAETTNS